MPKSLRLITPINDNGGFSWYRHVGKEEERQQQVEKDFPEHIQIFSSLSFCSTHTGVWVALITMSQMKRWAGNIEEGTKKKARWARKRESRVCASHFLSDEREKNHNNLSRYRLRRELYERIQAPDSKDEKGRGVAREFRKATGKKAL